MHEASPETLERGFGTLATDIVLVYYKPYVSCVIKEFEPITCFERIIIDRAFTLIADLCIVNLTDRFRMKLWLYLAIVTFRSQQILQSERQTIMSTLKSLTKLYGKRTSKMALFIDVFVP